jgi:hypothetical protein
MRYGWLPVLCGFLLGMPSLSRADLPRLLEEPSTLSPNGRREQSRTSDSTPREEPREPRRSSVKLGRHTEARSLPTDYDSSSSATRSTRRPSDDYEFDSDNPLDYRSPGSRRDGATRGRPTSRGRNSESSSERSRSGFGDRFRERFSDLFVPTKREEWLFSDHAFDHFATPISNPFLFEDPRSLTEIRPLFIYQSVPRQQPNFQGGDLYFFGARGSIALTERFSITLNKLGAISVAPSGASPFDSEFGFAELWLGPKFTFYRDPQFSTIMAAGAIFQIATGNEKVFQDTGDLSVTPYISVGKTLTEFRNLGSLNAIATAGYTFGTTRDRSDYFYLSGHLDFDLFNRQRFYPILEFNYFQYTTDGRARPFRGEGHDLINFGGQAKGASLVTGTIGGRFKITEAAQIGAGYELPLFGNKDVFRYRFTLDLIFRY